MTIAAYFTHEIHKLRTRNLFPRRFLLCNFSMAGIHFCQLCFGSSLPSRKKERRTESEIPFSSKIIRLMFHIFFQPGLQVNEAHPHLYPAAGSGLLILLMLYFSDIRCSFILYTIISSDLLTQFSKFERKIKQLSKIPVKSSMPYKVVTSTVRVEILSSTAISEVFRSSR